MGVAASSAKFGASPANPELFEVRPISAKVSGGAYPSTSTDLVSSWHVHEMHQIAYAAEGVVQVETASARYLLPPQQAAWIPAGLAHKTTLKRVRDVSIFLSPSLIEGRGDRVRVIVVEPVFREMILYSSRWPIDRASNDPVSDSYFSSMARLMVQWLDNELPFHLPTTSDPLIAAAINYTDEHLGSVSFEEVCLAVSASERSLRRRFVLEMGVTWQRYLLHSRLLRAMALLSESDSTIATVASKVGFGSASSFARAFAGYAGNTPTEYRRQH